MQPFSVKTIYTIFLGGIAYLICHLLFEHYMGFQWLVIRSLVFILIYAAGVLLLNLSPDVRPVLQTIAKRFTRGAK
jgi:hypothetical protein